MSKYEDLLDISVNELITNKTKPKTYVAIVFDESGSMSVLQNEIVSGLNTEISSIKKNGKEQDIKLSLTFFHTKVEEPLYWNIDINDFEEIKQEDYKPNGLTALYDGIGITINKLLTVSDIKDEDVSILMLIVTDGDENASKEFTSKKIFSIIKELTDTGRWTFSYLGTSDLKEVNSSLGIDFGNMRQFVNSAEGVANNAVYTSSSYNKYFNARSAGIKAFKEFYSEGTTTTNPDAGNITSGSTTTGEVEDK